jgi:pimeloyl-ACP methyl ester carboxylesterase
LVTPEQWKGMIAPPPPPELADYPDFEILDVDASAEEMRKAAAARPLRPMPLIVLSRGLPMELPPDASAKLPANFSAEQERIWRTSQDKLVALVPGAEHVVATKSGHYIQTIQPDLVIDAVRQGRSRPPGLARGHHPGSSLAGRSLPSLSRYSTGNRH